MTRYCALTTCNQAIWHAHGRAMVRTFMRCWPQEVALEVYCEEFWPEPPEKDLSKPTPWLGYTELYEAAPWLATWKALYRDPRYNGGQGGRDYRHDAVRFSHKVAALGAAAEKCDCDILLWLDADIVTHADVTLEWLDGLFPEPATIAWLDRERAYPECGFLMFRMPVGRKIIRNVVTMYRTGALFQLPEWHDSFVLQHVVNAMVQRGKAKAHSLSGPEGRKAIGHPFVNSPLAAYLDHLKGEIRKTHGRSLKQDLKVPRSEAYWK
jgi:hypothetical protein